MPETPGQPSVSRRLARRGATLCSAVLLRGLLLAGLALPAHASDRGNLVRDGGFERADPAQPAALPAELRTTSDGEDAEAVSFALDAEVRFSGQHSLRIRRAVNRGNARVALGVIPVRPGGRYYLACQIKSTEGRPGVLLGVQDHARRRVPPVFRDAVLLAPGATMNHDANIIMLPRATAPDPDAFNRLEFVFTVPEDAHHLTLHLNYGWVVGTAWFDDFQLFSLD